MITPENSNGQLGQAANEKPISPAQCRMARALLRWTQRDLARKAAVARRTVSDFESGLRLLRLRTRRDIANTFVNAGVVFEPNGGIRLTDTAASRNGRGPVNRVMTTPVWPLDRRGPPRA